MRTVGHRQMGSQAFERKSQAVTDIRNPPIVTLTGSTRFKREYIRANFDFTMAGFIVLSVGFFGHADKEFHTLTDAEKVDLDRLHKRKIELSDFVFVLDCPDDAGVPYIGSSTASEIEHARSLNIPTYRLSQVLKYLTDFPFIKAENYK
jgi:hypothetical protein